MRPTIVRAMTRPRRPGRAGGIARPRAWGGSARVAAESRGPVSLTWICTPPGCTTAHDHRSTGRRVADGVVDQVQQDTRDLCHPAFDVGQRRRELEAEIDPVPLGLRSHHVGPLREEGADPHTGRAIAAP